MTDPNPYCKSVPTLAARQHGAAPMTQAPTPEQIAEAIKHLRSIGSFTRDAADMIEALAAKQDDHRAKWTLNSGDEMFLVGEDGVGLSAAGHVIVKPLREWHALANTRPQPAPPAGEPDMVIDELKLAMANAVGGDDPGAVVNMPLVMAQRILARLGLAARPKVEDAEVDAENYGPGSWRRLLAQLREAEAKLAEREAELAKAENLLRLGSFPAAFYFTKEDWLSRHAARQQQKASAEPTEGEGNNEN